MASSIEHEIRDPDQHALDFATITAKQQETWSEGDFHQIARLNVVMAEALCEAAELRAGERVLDVACGSGTAALVATGRYCDVTGLDYVESLIERARWRARAEGMEADLLVGDAQELPFPDASFDAMLSVYGAPPRSCCGAASRSTSNRSIWTTCPKLRRASSTAYSDVWSVAPESFQNRAKGVAR